jgi:hypothetical protein
MKPIPLQYQGKIIPDYFVGADGSIFSMKTGKLKYMKPIVSGKMHYPKLRISMGDGTARSIAVHILVCYTYHEKPVPKGVDIMLWEQTPQQVKDAWPYQVNHKDHDINNFHPNNLEFVSTPLENSIKYREYLKTREVTSLESFLAA